MRRLQSVAIVVAGAATAFACNGIIGTTDIYYVDPTVGPVPDGGTNPVGDAQALVDSGGPCGDTQTSGENCGTCGHSCLGGQCALGVCQPVPIAASISPREIAVDTRHVYWTEPGVAYMKLSNLDGTNSVTLGGGTSNLLLGLAVDSTTAYWGSLDGIILRCAISGCGGTPTVLTAKADGVASVAVDDTNIYWVAQPSGVSTINKIAKTATMGTGTVIATSSTPSSQFYRLATDGTFVYFTADDGMIRKVSVNGGPAAVIGKGAASSVNLVIDAANVYWSTSDFMTGTINKTAKDGSTPDGVVLTGSQDLPEGLAVDANNLYWVDVGAGIGGTDGRIMTCPLSSCSTPQMLAKNQNAPENIAVDATSIYWTNYATGNPTGSIMRLAR